MKCIFLLIISSFVLTTMSAAKAKAWTMKGRWSTLQFNCQGDQIEISVDMNSRIGGGDAAPVRLAFMELNNQKLDAVWIVGASMDTISTNNRDHELSLGKHITIYSIGQGGKGKRCIML